ncbi:MAG: hypothetical protein HFG09_08215 [Oscillibacter sp.]|nr:hypothetical protein [Oscillibacter sp.]
MFLSQQDAQSIVEEVKAAIGRDINIMDETGRILASTNPARQGQPHPAAERILREQLPSLTVEEDQPEAGMQAGINLPVRIDGAAAGVIGITGPPEEVAGFGSVIKLLTEILVERARKNQQADRLERARGLFLESWLFSHQEDWADLEVRGRLLGFDLSSPYTVVILRLPRPALEGTVEHLREMRSTLILQMIRTRLGQDRRHECAVIRDQILILLCGLNRAKALAMAQGICRDVESYYAIQVPGGISGPSHSPADLRRCYQEARTASLAAAQSERSVLLFYDEASLEFLVQSIPQDLRQHLRGLVFSSCTDQERGAFSQLIRLYFQEDGDLRRCGERLFLHRNTVQYRLEALRRRTGYDLRRPKDAVLLYLASQEL